jgi:CrcB protein
VRLAARPVFGFQVWLRNELGRPFLSVRWFVIGVLAAMTVPEGRLLLSPSAREFLMIGVCGGYTTFSSFSLQTLTLAQEGDWFRVAANSFASIVCCLVAVWLGYGCLNFVNKP